MRWIATAIVGAAASAASAFVSSGAGRAVLIGIAAFSAILLAYWGSRSDRRVEEAHRYILELKEELATTAERAEAAHAQANRPIWERRNEEFEQMVAKPLEEPFRRVWNAAKRLIAPVQQFE